MCSVARLGQNLELVRPLNWLDLDVGQIMTLVRSLSWLDLDVFVYLLPGS